VARLPRRITNRPNDRLNSPKDIPCALCALRGQFPLLLQDVGGLCPHLSTHTISQRLPPLLSVRSAPPRLRVRILPSSFPSNLPLCSLRYLLFLSRFDLRPFDSFSTQPPLPNQPQVPVGRSRASFPHRPQTRWAQVSRPRPGKISDFFPKIDHFYRPLFAPNFNGTKGRTFVHLTHGAAEAGRQNHRFQQKETKETKILNGNLLVSPSLPSFPSVLGLLRALRVLRGESHRCETQTQPAAPATAARQLSTFHTFTPFTPLNLNQTGATHDHNNANTNQ